MRKKGLLWLAPVALVALVVACGGSDKQPVSPASPSPASAAGTNAGADGSTLKVNAPTLVSPINGFRLPDADATLTWQAATGKYVQGETFGYQVELYDAANTKLEGKTVSALTYKTTTQFDSDKEFHWRVRAVYQGAYGPWSGYATFKSMERPTGYMRGNEVYDPLIDGKTVGQVIGDVTWIPGQGIRLNGPNSAIEYALPSTCVTGEFSMLVSNVGGGSGIDKSVIMAMREGNGMPPSAREFLIDNDRRMTVEKRQDGTLAWRFISHDDQVDTIGGERVQAGVRDENTYLWTAIWNGAFTVRVQQFPAMNTIYQFGKVYKGAYDPTPHFAYAGSGTTFGGHGTVGGMIVRQVWLSPKPRPKWANQ